MKKRIINLVLFVLVIPLIVGWSSSSSLDKVSIRDEHIIKDDLEGIITDSALLQSMIKTVEEADIFQNVKKLGAKGDGIADDTAVIQTAIDNSDKDAVIYFPPGTYRITSPIMMKSQVYLIGVPDDNDYGGSVIAAGADMSAMITMENRKTDILNSSTIENLTFNGGKDKGYKVDWIINLGITSWRFINLKLHNMTGGGITTECQANASAWMHHIENVRIIADNNDEYAMKFYNSDSYFDGVYITGGKGFLDTRYGGNVYVNSIFEKSLGAGFTSQNPMVSIQNCSFRDNEVGLLLDFPTKGTNAYNICTPIADSEFIGNNKADVEFVNVCEVSLYRNNFKSINTTSGKNLITSDYVYGNILIENNFSYNELTLPGSGFRTYNNKFEVDNNWWTTSGISPILPKEVYKKLYKTASVSIPNMMVVNVKDFGAEGDGVTDDSLSIQNAINAVPEGGVVYLPKGKYIVNKPITLKSNFTLLGNGFYSTFIHAGADIECLFKTDGLTSNVVFSSMYLNVEVGYDVENTLYLDDMTDSAFINSAIKNDTGDVIYVGENSSNLLFKNLITGVPNATSENGSAIILKGTDCIIQNNYISRHQHGIIIEGKGGHYIYNNHLDHGYNAAILFRNAERGMKPVHVFNNYLDLNVQGVAFRYDTLNTNKIYVKSSMFRNSGVIQTNDENGNLTSVKEVPEIGVKNARNVQFYSNMFENRLLGGYNFKFEGDTDYLTIIGNVGPRLYDEKNSGDYGKNTRFFTNWRE